MKIKAIPISRRAWVASLLLGLGWTAPGALADLQVSVAPTHLPWGSNAWVNVVVSNVPAGSGMDIGLYVDVAGNGLLDEIDPLVASYRVQEGKMNPLGSSIIVDDSDGLTNGIVDSRIAYFGSGGGGAQSLVGNYLWQVRTIGATSEVARFSVTQPTSTVWVSGAVIDYATSNAIPAAGVRLGCFTDSIIPTVWTDPNGLFSIYLPDGISTADVNTVSVTGLGYFNPSTKGPGGEPVSEYAFANDLHLGENPVPIALRVVPKIPGVIFEVTGHIYDSRTNALPGVIVQIAGKDGNVSVAITGTDGAYRIPVPAYDGCTMSISAKSLMHVGLMAVSQSLTVNEDMADVDIYCPQATLLARGTVLAADDAAPIAGISVDFSGNALSAQGVSLMNGAYEVGLVSYTNYSAKTDGAALKALGFLKAPGLEGLSITNNSVTHLDFLVERGYPISGHVYDAETNALTGGTVNAYRYQSPTHEGSRSTGVNRHGAYRLLAQTGSLAVAARDFSGHLGKTYSNHFFWERDEFGEVADPVLNTPAGASGIDFFLPQAAQIQGVVRGASQPIAGVFVNAGVVMDSGGKRQWAPAGVAITDSNGWYSLDVPAGTNYGVNADFPERGGFCWLREYYVNATELDAATLVSTAAGAPATNIDFDLAPGGIISGWVYEENGTTPVPRCGVDVESLANNSIRSSQTFDDGYYEITVPAGEYLVVAKGDAASYGVRMFYSGWFDNQREQANVVTALVGQVTGNINFALDPGGTISGRVTEDDGFTPVSKCPVQARLGISFVMGSGQTDPDGYYSFRVPSNTYMVVAHPEWAKLSYAPQYYSNATSQADSRGVHVARNGESTNIHFRLVSGGTISGRVYDENDASAIGNCFITVEDFDNREWKANTTTKEDGSYSVQVIAGRYRVQTLTEKNGQAYVNEWYSNTIYRAEAVAVTVTDGNHTPDIDFALEVGGTISGHVYQEDGMTPLVNCPVYGVDTNSNDWVGGGSTDDGGSYILRLPASAYRVYAVPYEAGLLFENKYFSNTYFLGEATLIVVTDSNNTSSVDFTLAPGGTIAGHVYAADGVTPVLRCMVGAEDPANQEWLGWDSSEEDGSYMLVAPTGRSYKVVAQPSVLGNPYSAQYYNGVAVVSDATPTSLPDTNSVPGIDFILSPLDCDNDADGMRDSWECEQFGNMRRNGIGDYDDDGSPDRDEWIAWTRPTDKTDYFHIEADVTDSSAFDWTTASGRLYTVQFTTNLVLHGWQTNAGLGLGDGTVWRYTNIGGASTYYRVGVRLGD